MENARVDYEQFGVIIRNVEACRCPRCESEVVLYPGGKRRVVIEAVAPKKKDH